MQSEWKNVRGEYTVEIYADHDGVVREIEFHRELPVDLDVKMSDNYELCIAFLSSGFYDPGSMYGGPDNLGRPPEGDEERIFSRAYLQDGRKVVELSPEDGEKLFEFFEEEIDEVVLEGE